MKQQHLYHLVDISAWPLVASLGSFLLTSGLVIWFHGYGSLVNGSLVVFLGLGVLLGVMFVWWRDIIREGSFEGRHTSRVVRGLKMGMILFIISEVCVFLSIFWAYFHSALSPSIELGSTWPPRGISSIDPRTIPLLNTLLLLTSGATITWAHHGLIKGDRKEVIRGLIITILLGITFTIVQGMEYYYADFTLTDSVYGSVFYGATATHGIHVIIGTLFLLICLIRVINYHFTKRHHFGFEAASWYWHFVDVVWLFLYLMVYFWGW